MPFIQPDADIELALGPLMETWRTLALCTGQADPVCCAPDWNLAFYKSFQEGSKVFYSWLEDNLVILVENIDTDGRFYLVPLENSWMFSNPLLGFYSPDLLGIILSEIEAEYPETNPIIVLGGVQTESFGAARLYNLYSRQYGFFRAGSQAQCCASLSGGLDGWLGRRSANHRAKLRKASRRAANRGVEFERVRPDNAAEANTVFDRMIEVELKSWKGIGHCGMAENASSVFYRELLSRISGHGGGFVIFARLEGRDIGYIFGSAASRYYRGQQFSYMQEFADLSIGNLLQFEKIKWLCQEGYERYDMGPVTGPRMEYKLHWTEQSCPMETWVLRKKS